MSELISIILTTRNSERFIGRSIESCLRQTYPHLELLIIDGNSTDHTLEIVRSFSDPRIQIIHQPNNQGKLPGALNLGMKNARGAYLTWTQDDSWYDPTALQKMVTHLEANKHLALVYSNYWMVDEEERPLRHYQVKPPAWSWFLTEDVIGQCFLFRRIVWETLGEQDIEAFPVHEIPWRAKLFQTFAIAPLPETLMYYTVHAASLTGRIGGWVLQRMMVAELHRGRFINWGKRNQLLAKIAIDQAFAEFMNHNFGGVWRYGLAGIGRDWHHLNNRGLLKLLILSLSPYRHQHQAKMRANWEAREQAILSAELPTFAATSQQNFLPPCK